MRDDAWFERLYRDHTTAVYRYFVRRAPADDVEDLTAEVLATAWRRRADVPEEAVLPLLYRTAGFVLANHRRKHLPVPVEQLRDGPDNGGDPALAAISDTRAVARRRSACEAAVPRLPWSVDARPPRP